MKGLVSRTKHTEEKGQEVVLFYSFNLLSNLFTG